MQRVFYLVQGFTHTTFSSLKIRNYRLYFIGQGISLCGTWMQTIGQSWLVLELTNSGAALGLVTGLQWGPVLLLGPWGGLIAERVSKRRLLFITQASAGILALILAVLVATHTVTLWMVYVLAGALGVVNSFDNPARQSFLFEMVGHKDIINAVTLNSTEVNLARVLGPAIAGALIASIGLAACFFINAASYIAVLVCLGLMNGHALLRSEPIQRAKGQLREGFRYIYNTPMLRDLLIMLVIVGTFTYEFQVSLALLAKYTFHGSAGDYALLTAGLGIGSVIGGIATAGRKKTDPQGLNWIVIVFAVAMVLTALSPNMAFAELLMVIVGICSICFTSLGNSILQLESAPQMRSRVMSFWSVAFLGSTPIGGPIIGWIGQYANPRWGIAVGGIAALAAGIFGMIVMSKYPPHKSRREAAIQSLAAK